MAKHQFNTKKNFKKWQKQTNKKKHHKIHLKLVLNCLKTNKIIVTRKINVSINY